MKYSAIVLAAGKGQRTNLVYNKVMHKLDNGNMIIMESMANFILDEECRQLILVCAKEEMAYFRKLNISSKAILVVGGKTRQESVFNGLKRVSEDYVMIHDGARPWLKMESVNSIKKGLLSEDACFLAVPAIDTVKNVSNTYVKETISRDNCYLAQTPQAFRTSLILECHNKAIKENISVSDDVMLIELLSDTRIKVIEGDYANKKVTTEMDLK